MIISYLRLEPQVWVLEHRLMAQEVMQVTSPRNSLNGLAAPGQGSGEWGYPPDKWRDWYDAKAGITRAPLEDAEEPRTRQETEDWGPESGSCCENPITPILVGECLTLSSIADSLTAEFGTLAPNADGARDGAKRVGT
jgi:hypothetical protein